MWDDDNGEMSIGGKSEAERLFSSVELCSFVRDTFEAKHGVTIAGIDYEDGVFTFTILTSDIGEMDIPFRWEPISFGYGTITFTISLEEFESHYHKIEGRDFMASVKVAMKRRYGDVCEIISVNNPISPVLGEGVEVVVRLKEGCTLNFGNENPWIPMVWAKENLLAFEIDDSSLQLLLNS